MLGYLKRLVVTGAAYQFGDVLAKALALLTAIAVFVFAAAVLLIAPTSLHFGLKGSRSSASNATSGRSTLVEQGLKLFAKRPLEGYGAGSFETEYRRVS